MDAPAPRTSGRPLLLGHRGCRGAFTENTFAAFDHALASGCDGFEFDVRLTADQRAIIWHDSVINETHIGLETYDVCLKQCMSSRRSLSRTRPRIELCLLEQVIARYAARAFLNIEHKVPGAEQLTIDLCRAHNAQRVVVSSFLREVVTRLHALAPDIPVGFIFDTREGLRHWRELPITHLMPHHRLLTQAAIDDMHAAGRQVFAWTVNDPGRMKRLAKWGIDGLISDDPVLLCNTLGGKQVVNTQRVPRGTL